MNEEIIFSFQRDEIFKDQMIFDSKYKPSTLIHREKEKLALINIFEELVKRRNHIEIQGPPGTGKTLVTLRVAEKFIASEAEHKVKTIYINCSERCNTKTKILLRIALELNSNGKIGWMPDQNLDIIDDFINKGNKLCIILDEVNQIQIKPRNELNTTLYTLTNHSGISLILISNENYWRSNITDMGVLSRLQKNTITFLPYSKEHLYDILLKRAEIGLMEDTFDTEAIHEISRIAADTTQDVRSGLEILYQCAQHIKRTKQKKITKKIVEEVTKNMVLDNEMEVLKKLSITKLLILLVTYHCWKFGNRKKKYPKIDQMYAEYQRQVKLNPRYIPLTEKSFRVYVRNLSVYGFLTPQTSTDTGGRGRRAITYKLDVDEDAFVREVYDPAYSIK
jgi:cell division control protein 6